MVPARHTDGFSPDARLIIFLVERHKVIGSGSLSAARDYKEKRTAILKDTEKFLASED